MGRGQQASNWTRHIIITRPEATLDVLGESAWKRFWDLLMFFSSCSQRLALMHLAAGEGVRGENETPRSQKKKT